MIPYSQKTKEKKPLHAGERGGLARSPRPSPSQKGHLRTLDTGVLRIEFSFLPKGILQTFLNHCDQLERALQQALLEAHPERRRRLHGDGLTLLRRMYYDLHLFELKHPEPLRGNKRELLDAMYWWIQKQIDRVLSSEDGEPAENPLVELKGSPLERRAFWEEMARLAEFANYDVFQSFLEQHMEHYKTPFTLECLPLMPYDDCPPTERKENGLKAFFPNHWGRQIFPRKIRKGTVALYLDIPHFLFWFRDLAGQCPFFERDEKVGSLLKQYLEMDSAPMSGRDFLKISGGCSPEEHGPHREEAQGRPKAYGMYYPDAQVGLDEYFNRIQKRARGFNKKNEDRKQVFLEDLENCIETLVLPKSCEENPFYSFVGKSNKRYRILIEELFMDVANLEIGTNLLSLLGRNVRLRPVLTLSSEELVEHLETLLPRFLKQVTSSDSSAMLPKKIGQLYVQKEMEKRGKKGSWLEAIFERQTHQFESFIQLIQQLKAYPLPVVVYENITPAVTSFDEGAKRIDEGVLYETLGELGILYKLVGDPRFEGSRVNLKNYEKNFEIDLENQDQVLIMYPQKIDCGYTARSFYKRTKEGKKIGLDPVEKDELLRGFFEDFSKGWNFLMKNDLLHDLQFDSIGYPSKLSPKEQTVRMSLAIGVMRTFLQVYLKYPSIALLKNRLTLFGNKRALMASAFDRLQRIEESVDELGFEKLASLCEFYKTKMKGESSISLAHGEASLAGRVKKLSLGRLLEIEGNQVLWMIGIMDFAGMRAIRTVIRENPQVRVVVLESIPGTNALGELLDLSRLIYLRNMVIVLSPSARVASGGSTLLLGAIKSFIFAFEDSNVCTEKRVGVHEASHASVNATGRNLPMDHPSVHQYTSFLEDVGFTEKEALAIYRFKTNAAPNKDMYYLKEEEINQWGYGEIVRIPRDMPMDEALRIHVVPRLDEPKERKRLDLSAFPE